MRKLTDIDWRLTELEAELRAIEHSTCEQTDDADIESVGDKIEELEWAIARTKASTPAGVAVKVKRLWANLDTGVAVWQAENFQTILASLQAMSAEKFDE